MKLVPRGDRTLCAEKMLFLSIFNVPKYQAISPKNGAVSQKRKSNLKQFLRKSRNVVEIVSHGSHLSP
jgi:hypothetical protein